MDSNLLQAVTGPACRSYAEVLAKLAAVEAALDERDGLRWFTRLYRAMTEAVAKSAAQGAFRDPAFLQILDCTFAELYFAAIAAHLRAGDEPRAWSPLLEARSDVRISPLQFAVAGVNAHINRDLPVALVASFQRVDAAPDRSDARHADYLLVNRILSEVHGQAKTFLFSGALVEVDALLGRCDDVLELWSLERARDAAWVAGEVQWHLRISAFLAGQHLATLDQLVGCTSRGLLRPVLALASLA